jgi:hypothetical protein
LAIYKRCVPVTDAGGIGLQCDLVDEWCDTGDVIELFAIGARGSEVDHRALLLEVALERERLARAVERDGQVKSQIECGLHVHVEEELLA